jgi:hypothetical protein
MSFIRSCWMTGCNKDFMTSSLDDHYCPSCRKLAIEERMRRQTIYSSNTVNIWKHKEREK